MKGLLIKDFMYMKKQKSFLLLILAASAYMMVALADVSFMIGYISCIYCMFLVGTISYDELDNGYAFLFTLPFSRKDYAVSKYLFGLLWCFTGGLGMAVLYAIGLCAKGVKPETMGVILNAIIFLTVGILVMAFMLPLQFKYGNAKFGLSMSVMCILIAVIGYILYTLPMFDLLLLDLIRMLETTGPGLLGCMLLASALAAMIISLLISVRVIERKEM